MAADSEQDGQEEVSEEIRLAFAVRAIQRDPNLRLFCRRYLAHCGALFPSSVFDNDAARNAYNQGVQAAGVEFARMLTSAEPSLWPALLVEEMNDAKVDS